MHRASLTRDARYCRVLNSGVRRRGRSPCSSNEDASAILPPPPPHTHPSPIKSSGFHHTEPVLCFAMEKKDPDALTPFFLVVGGGVKNMALCYAPRCIFAGAQ